MLLIYSKGSKMGTKYLKFWKINIIYYKMRYNNFMDELSKKQRRVG